MKNENICRFPSFSFFIARDSGSADQNDINQKLQQGGIIHLPAGNCVLTDSIILQSNTILEGEPGTIITIPDHAGWPEWKPLISGTGVQNITIRDLEINANSEEIQKLRTVPDSTTASM